jgi:hypothetical protein
MSTCPICDSPLQEITERKGDYNLYDCPLCGKFSLTGSLVASLPHLREKNKDASTKLSHATRTMQSSNSEVDLNTYIVDEIINKPLPSPTEQADLLIRWLADNVSGPGETIWVEPGAHRSIIGAKSAEGFDLILDHLFAAGLVTGNQSNAIGAPGRAHVTLSFEGWRYLEVLKQGGATYRKAFMAMKFGVPELDEVLKKVFKPAAKAAGFELFKLDDVPVAGLIDDRLRVEIQAADFIVADLSHDNLGAYWEAGYAEGLGKPVIYTCESEKFQNHKTHFDTNHHLTIVWDKNNPNLAGEQLKATIRATLPTSAKHRDE